MLSLILSTIVFVVAAYFLNRYLDDLGVDRSLSRKMLVGTLATVISIGSGWAIDELDGDAAKAASQASRPGALQSGDPTQMLKALAGLK